MEPLIITTENRHRLWSLLQPVRGDKVILTSNNEVWGKDKGELIVLAELISFPTSHQNNQTLYVKVIGQNRRLPEHLQVMVNKAPLFWWHSIQKLETEEEEVAWLL